MDNIRSYRDYSKKLNELLVYLNNNDESQLTNYPKG
jgi:hypothetical protein